VAHSIGRQLRASFAVALALACSASNGKEYAAAATGLVGVVSATAVYRTQKGGCWAICSPGYACDRQRGTCHRIECSPACAPNETCFIEADNNFRCIDTLGSGRFGTSPSLPSVSSSVPASSAATPASSAGPN